MAMWMMVVSVGLAGAGSDEDKQVAAVVTRFGRAAESRDVAALTATLAPQAVQRVRMGDAWSALPTDVYLGLMSEGKIGGEPVDVDILDVDRTGPVSTVVARRSTPSFTFDDTYVLVRQQSGWTIVSAAVVVTPAGNSSGPRPDGLRN